ncbi:MAG: RluA family pseudouridine synthase [Planctomycetes bacterium]|nr:RluA family pseudouridine synthase [Planctomycetota bacterium]
MQEITLTEAEAGQRLDRYLRKLLPAVPLGAIFRLLRQGDIRVDGRKCKGDLRLTAGMKVSLRLPAAEIRPAPSRPSAGGTNGRDDLDVLDLLPSPDLGPARGRAAADSPLAPRIVFRDDQVLVVSKPAGLAIHPGTRQEHSLTGWLQTQRLGVRTATFAPAPAHRLDRGTSGLVVIGLTPDALRGLTAAFREGTVDKVYFAVVHGVPSRPTGTITAPLWQDPDADPRAAKVLVDERGQPARTDYELVKQGRHMALLRVQPHSGRQHQIRAHLSHIGHPIVGDHRYGSIAEVGRGFLLHAGELAFPHPRTGKKVRYSDPMPKDFHKLLDPD